MGRRRFLGFVLAAPTLAVAAKVGVDAFEPRAAGAAVPSPPEPSDLMDLGDVLTPGRRADVRAHHRAGPRRRHGGARPATGRSGAGHQTAVAMLIADELDLPLDQVHVSLADARPELLFNQLTGGSNSIRSLYTPVHTAATLARQRLIQAAAARWQVDASTLTTSAGVVHGAGRTATYGSLAAAASARLWCAGRRRSTARWCRRGAHVAISRAAP